MSQREALLVRCVSRRRAPLFKEIRRRTGVLDVAHTGTNETRRDARAYAGSNRGATIWCGYTKDVIGSSTRCGERTPNALYYME